jgi:hypothetical protein
MRGRAAPSRTLWRLASTPLLLACLALLLVWPPGTGASDGNGLAEARWAERQVGKVAWRAPGGGRQESITDVGWCLKFAAHAYGAKKVGYEDARSLLSAMERAGRVEHTPLDDAPEGALAFFDVSSYGHVGVHVGAGFVVHAGYEETVELDHYRSIERYVGWVYPVPATWPGRWSRATAHPPGD